MALGDEPKQSPFTPGSEPTGHDDAEKPELDFDPGELAPFWASSYPAAELSEKAISALKSLCDLIGNKDVAARRWEVEQSWEARLFDRGYQYLLPRKGGGWILPPFATDYNRPNARQNGMKFYGYETNIYTTYGEIVTAALTRDVPQVRFVPYNPEDPADITAANSAKQYAKIFARNNDLRDLQHQLVYYLRNDGRAVMCVDHVLDAQRFGREEPEEPSAVPETETPTKPVLIYVIRHGETVKNREGMTRGNTETGLDEAGKREIDRAATWLRDKGVRAVVSSPSPRSVESAQIISAKLGLPVDVDERFSPLNIGDLAGQPSASVIPQISEAFETDEPLPGGERPSEFSARVQQGLFEMLQSGLAPLALVVHDSVITAMWRIIEGAENATGQVDHGSIAAIEPAGDSSFKIYHVFPYQRPTTPIGQHRGVPRGIEQVSVYGKLEAKVPMNSMTLQDMDWVQLSKEYDVAHAKAMFPEKAKEIKPGGATSGENELDRIARINAALGLEASYVTGDSMVRDCTVQRTWMRPSFFMEEKDEEVREELFNKFPEGCLVVIAGEAFVLARNECMDDHLTLLHAFPGSGQNRIAIMSKVLSLQKRLNNWMDLMNDFYIRTVPQRYINAKLFDVDAIRDQTNRPGPYIPFDPDELPPGKGLADVGVWVEPTPTHQPSMPEFIRSFMEEWPQLLSGALPSIFGAEDNTDTATGVAIQRDQALGRLGTPWHNIQVATCNYFRQAVQLAAQCRNQDVVGPDDKGSIIHVELADLRGRVLAYPEEDANFPESWNQKQQRYQTIVIEAATNPFAAKLLASPANFRVARDMAGFQEFKVPEADCYEKQLGEFDLLLKTGPVPNPQKLALLSQADLLSRQGNLGVEGTDEGKAALAMQVAQMPDFISTVPVADTDNHPIEAQACLDWINSPDGRRCKNGTQQERAGFENIHLHWSEHIAATKPPDEPMKPMSFSAPIKDLDPGAAAQALERQGIHTSPEAIQQQRVTEVVLKAAAKPKPEGPPSKAKKGD